MYRHLSLVENPASEFFLEHFRCTFCLLLVCLGD